MNLIVTGTESFIDYRFLECKLDHLLSRTDMSQVTIFSNCRQGAAQLGEKYAMVRGIKIFRFPGNWENINIDNSVLQFRIPEGLKTIYSSGNNDKERILVDYAAKKDAAIVLFWDHHCPALQTVLEMVKGRNFRVRVIDYPTSESQYRAAA